VPLDTATILASVEKTSKVLIVHEDTHTGGFGAELAATIAEEAFEFLDGPIRRLTGPDVPAMPFSAALEDAFMLNPAKIAQAMRDLAAY
jgi:2-oxoisovalerate dehydrogenase E1 component beta subunit